MAEAEPRIDFARVTFPSDQFTIRMLRTAYPGAFDRPAALPENRTQFHGRASIEDALGGTIDFERRLAVLEFKRVLGLQPTEEEVAFSRANLAETLTDEYVHLGSATGEHHSAQLIRDVESQASSQAHHHLGQTPP